MPRGWAGFRSMTKGWAGFYSQFRQPALGPRERIVRVPDLQPGDRVVRKLWPLNVREAPSIDAVVSSVRPDNSDPTHVRVYFRGGLQGGWAKWKTVVVRDKRV